MSIGYLEPLVYIIYLVYYIMFYLIYSCMRIHCYLQHVTGCPSALKNKEGKTPRMLAKDNEQKDALKECRKAEKQSAKLAKGGSRTGEPFAIRVSLQGSGKFVNGWHNQLYLLNYFTFWYM